MEFYFELALEIVDSQSDWPDNATDFSAKSTADLLSWYPLTLIRGLCTEFHSAIHHSTREREEESERAREQGGKREALTTFTLEPPL